MYNRRHCYLHKSTDSAWQKPETCNWSNPLKPPWSFILWSIWFVLFSPMILFSFNFIPYSSFLKYIFQGEKGQRGKWIKVLPYARQQLAQQEVPNSSSQPSSPWSHIPLVKWDFPMTVGLGRWVFHLSVVAGHSPKVKCGEDAFIFKGEASLLFNLLLCL